jgi:hypothetical protein
MDLLKEIKEKVRSNSDWTVKHGVQSVVTHIEVAERHHFQAKSDRNEHLYTDVIYRTNHAFEGILKEAYVCLAEKSAERLTPHDIEEYLLTSDVLKKRVVDLIKNYRQNWRNPSTHDYQLFFSEQESFLAIVTVSALLSILLDQMLERVAYTTKFKSLENAASLARDKIANFQELPLIDKVWKILLSFTDHYIKNFTTMSVFPRHSANAQLAAFIKKVAPELTIDLESEMTATNPPIRFDLKIGEAGDCVVVETREPVGLDMYEDDSTIEAAVSQISWRLYATGLKNGVVFFFPGRADHAGLATTASTSWPKDLNLKVVWATELQHTEMDDHEEPVVLVD